MSNELTEDQLIEAIVALEEHGTKSAAAEALQLPVSTYKNRLKKARQEGYDIPDNYQKSKNVVIRESNAGDTVKLSTAGPIITTVDQAIEEAGLDLDKFDIVKSSVRTWTVTMKLDGENPDTGVKEQKPFKTTNYYISIETKRKAPKFVHDAIDAICQSVPVINLDFPKVPKHTEQDLTLELGLYDVHFGKLAWRMQTGQDYDLELAEEVFSNAVADLLNDMPTDRIKKIVVPIGNDFFHANNWKSETARGTRVESVDDRMSKVFEAGERAVTNLAIAASKIAPVDFIWLPGNHDPETSWYLMKVVKSRFLYSDVIDVDLSPSKHKWYNFGKNLILYTHGDTIKRNDDLPLFMATHCPADMWANSTCREIHTGHIHTRTEKAWKTAQEKYGIVWRTLPSLSATDEWHFDNFYTGNLRAAMAFLWKDSGGLKGWVQEEARNGT